MIAEDLGDDEQRLQISASMTSMAVIATGRSSSQRALLVVSSGVQFLLHFDAVENRRNRRNRQKNLIKHTTFCAVQEFSGCCLLFRTFASWLLLASN